MADLVMPPVIVILAGALLIAVGLFYASSLALGIGIVLDIAGVAILLIGMIMLFALAKEKTIEKK